MPAEGAILSEWPGYPIQLDRTVYPRGVQVASIAAIWGFCRRA